MNKYNFQQLLKCTLLLIATFILLCCSGDDCVDGYAGIYQGNSSCTQGFGNGTETIRLEVSTENNMLLVWEGVAPPIIVPAIVSEDCATLTVPSITPQGYTNSIQGQFAKNGSSLIGNLNFSNNGAQCSFILTKLQ